MKEPIRLALIWHFHQPDYTDPATGAASMPWTRLHALKDYADMAAFLERHPAVRATFNVVPTLLDQLGALASGGVRPDAFLALALKDPTDLSMEERAFVIGHFFSLNRDMMAVGLKRLNELFALRGDAPVAEIGKNVIERFDDQALLDLQVLFHLAWSGPLLQGDPLIASLKARGRGFTDEDKRALFARQQESLSDVIPRWRRLYDAEQVELSVTPYYHPILPLLCDIGSAREALPDIRLPAARFHCPEDAQIQIARGMEAFAATFGRNAAGGWPSEGALSAEALRQLGAAGYRWTASDEDMLFAALGETFPADAGREAYRAERLYRPWRLGDGPAILFRDHDLSDRIGFVYASRPAQQAAADFVSRLLHLREVLPDDGTPYVVSVILDGENAWEHYPDHAAPFFDALYGALAAEPDIRTVTASEAAQATEPRALPRIVAGSWIYRNLATWIGHPEKNRAWELLAAARDSVVAAKGAPSWDEPAWRAIFAAEGSDWFWWYGDDHPTEYGAEFDAGFRDKLRGAYVACGLPVPPTIEEPIRKRLARGLTAPTGPVEATIDGRVGDYFEWRTAGRLACVFGAMHAAVPFARDLYFGSDGRSLFVRIDPVEPGALADAAVTVRVPDPDAAPIEAVVGGTKGEVRMALDRVLELSVPLERLAAPGSQVRFAIEIRGPNGATQRVPPDGFVDLPRPEEDPARFDWWV